MIGDAQELVSLVYRSEQTQGSEAPIHSAHSQMLGDGTLIAGRFVELDGKVGNVLHVETVVKGWCERISSLCRRLFALLRCGHSY